MMTKDEEKEVMKAAFKEGLKEWLTEKSSQFGWWSMKTLGALSLAALVYFILMTNGWHR